MSAIALNLSPTLHRLGPMREGFVWWRKICGFCTPLQRKIRGSCLALHSPKSGEKCKKEALFGVI